MTSTQLIDELVKITHGGSDQRTQHMYRDALRMLVGISKLEQRDEHTEDELGHRFRRGFLH